MPSPRALLRGFLASRFREEGTLRRFVRDHFEELVPELADDNLLAEAETFIGGLTDRGLIGDLWPRLREDRPKYLDEIAELEAVWAAAASGSSVSTGDLASNDLPLLDRAQLKLVYNAARAAKLESSRPALLAGIADDLARAIPRVPRPSAQLLTDLDRLSRVPGEPPPLRLWLENALLVLTDNEDGSVFEQTLAALDAAGAEAEAAATTAEAAPAADGESALEAIILAGTRPALLVRDGAIDPAEGGSWRQSLADARPQLEKAIAATGRLEIAGHPSLSWVGTGFAVAEDIVCSVRHTLDVGFDGKRWRKGPSGKPMGLGWNPHREDGTAAGRDFPVAEVLLYHPVLDVAFLRVPDLAEERIMPLVLAGRAPEPGTALARITYVAQDARVDMDLQQRIFRGILEGRKWVLPGKAMKVEEPRGDQPMLAYDITTLGGTGGSPVVGLADGRVLGIGALRQYLIANWAVPAWELLRDPRIRDLGVKVPDDALPPDDPWAEDWKRV